MESRVIIEAALQSDPAITPEQRKRILSGFEPPKKAEPWMTRKQVGEILNLHPGSIKRYDGKLLHPVRITPRTVRYDAAEVEALLNKRGA